MTGSLLLLRFQSLVLLLDLLGIGLPVEIHPLLPVFDLVEDLLFRLGRLIRYNSEYFRVRIRVSSRPAPINVEAIVLRDKRDPKLVRWEVH